MDYSEDYNRKLTEIKFYDNTLCDSCQREEARIDLDSNLCDDCAWLIGE